MKPPTRVILTGEYPPQAGGVADHSRVLAAALAQEGETVHVFAPACPGGGSDTSGGIHRLAGGFGLRGLRALSRELAALPQGRRILVQYVPQAFGLKAMNVPFCMWLFRRREPVDILFHEVAVPWGSAQPLKYNVLAPVQRAMARFATARAARKLVATTAWIPLLERIGVRGPFQHAPVPSNLPTSAEGSRASALRAALAPPGATLIGHFGTHGDPVASLLEQALLRLLRGQPERAAWLVGRGGQAFREALVTRHPWVEQRVLAFPDLDGPAAAAHLAACDLLVQPYPDGVTTRRGSVMAGLALGVAVVTNSGPLTDPVWREDPGPLLVPQPEMIADGAERLLGDPRARGEVATRGAQLYAGRFDVRHLVRVITGCDGSWPTARATRPERPVASFPREP